MVVAVRYLISHPDAVAELGDLDVALYDGTQPVPENPASAAGFRSGGGRGPLGLGLVDRAG